ncbi:MAG: hypothetical protein QNJ46_11290 [Leptolyngbyaceae cyanobacterium MO_188.B28]|nr:hypothetical protein [Leptolyngbyaceae cyanobacterium MO_188.B28]
MLGSISTVWDKKPANTASETASHFPEFSRHPDSLMALKRL